ncbi:MAG: hypothetical protein SFW35_09605 [Chitinophagales bacterium]|nr:hypothetical protein [Chitinophagales bacterium]
MARTSITATKEKLHMLIDSVEDATLLELHLQLLQKHVGNADEGDTKEEIVKNLKKGFEEMKLFKEGKTKGTALKDFLNEL